MGDNNRNFNPTPEARVAWALWSEEYAYQRLGLMDWYDTLDDDRKKRAERNAKEIIGAAIAQGRTGTDDNPDQSARIAELEAALAEAMEALKPFAREGNKHHGTGTGDAELLDEFMSELTIGDLRRARLVLSKRVEV